MLSEPTHSTTAPDLLAPLMEDHALARSVLDSMEIAAMRIEDGGPIDFGFWRLVLLFFDDYFDQIHHPAEEHLLLPLLYREGFGRPHTAAAQMSREHERMGPCRLHLQNAVHVQSVPRLRAAIRAFVNLHRAHMDLEERHVFPMAWAVLGGAEQHELRQGFAQLDAGEAGQARQQARELACIIRDSVSQAR